MKTNPTTYGYVVAPYGDKAARTDQMQALEEYTPDYLLIDREYKTRTNRTSLEHILDMIQPEDVLVTTKLSNLGRSYAEILENWKLITEEKGAFIVSIEPPAVGEGVVKNSRREKDTRKSRSRLLRHRRSGQEKH